MRGGRVGPALRLVAGAVLFWAVLALPDRPAALADGTLLRLPPELPVLLLALLAAGRVRALRWAVVAVLMLVLVQKGADLSMRTALGRSFNAAGDLPLIDAMLRLVSGAVGTPLTVALVAGLLLTLAGAALALGWAARGWGGALAPGVARRGAGLTAVLATAGLVLDTGAARGAWDAPDLPGRAATVHLALDRAGTAAETLEGVRDFARIVEEDAWRGRSGLLDALDRDLLVIFVESYGRASLDVPLYADTHRATLRAAEARLAEAGLSMRSGWLASPTRGGRSWLAHEAFAGGLWTTDQARYLAALSSGRETLYHVARRSGFRTAAVMPAITLDWPEAQTMGFDAILPAADLGYRGKPFNWVTMPDQYTLTALDRLVRDADAAPVVAQVALISSHAPWTPVPEPIDWDDVGDGRAFDAMATSGETPQTVWADRDTTRDHYRRAVDYTLGIVADYALRHADDPPLIVMLGDHQTAGYLALDERADVPIHVIGPAALVDRTAALAPTPGMIPADDAPVTRMDGARDLLIGALTDADAGGGA